MVQLTAKQSDIIHSDQANERRVPEMHVLSIYVTPKHSPLQRLPFWKHCLSKEQASIGKSTCMALHLIKQPSQWYKRHCYSLHCWTQALTGITKQTARKLCARLSGVHTTALSSHTSTNRTRCRRHKKEKLHPSVGRRASYHFPELLLPSTEIARCYWSNFTTLKTNKQKNLKANCM